MGQDLAMEKSFLLDTDVLIDFFRGYNKAVSFVNRYSSRIILSSIGVAELYAGVKKGQNKFHWRISFRFFMLYL